MVKICHYLSVCIALLLNLVVLQGCGRGPDVVSLAPELTELTASLGQEGRLKGVSQGDDYPSDVLALPRAGTPEAPDLAALESLKPGIILTTVATPELASFAATHDARVVESGALRLSNLDDAIGIVAAALGAEKQADAVRASITTEKERLSAKLADKEHRKVLLVTGREGASVDRVKVAGKDSLASDLLTLAAGDNVFADKPGSEVEVTLAEIQARAPEVILELHPGLSLTDNQRQDLYGTWNAARDLPAMARGAIFFITDSFCLRPGPRVIESATLIAKTIYGDFDWDMASVR